MIKKSLLVLLGIFFIFILLTGCTSQQTSKSEELIGTWKLRSCEYKGKNGTFHPFGQEPLGYLIYDKSGYMSGIITRKDRNNATSGAYNGYSGKFEVLEGKIVHHIEVSYHPDWTGRSLDRFYKLDGNTLTLTTPEAESSLGVGTLVWEKVKP